MKEREREKKTKKKKRRRRSSPRSNPGGERVARRGCCLAHSLGTVVLLSFSFSAVSLHTLLRTCRCLGLRRSTIKHDDTPHVWAMQEPPPPFPSSHPPWTEGSSSSSLNHLSGRHSPCKRSIHSIIGL